MGWIGVDLDGTLAEYHHLVDLVTIGKPIKPMVDRVKRWLAEGRDVRVFTARVSHLEGHNDLTNDSFVSNVDIINAIQDWCEIHIGQRLPVTCVKDFRMIELWDDRAVQVEMNVGEPIGHSTRGLA
jgi:hypothetical protein